MSSCVVFVLDVCFPIRNMLDWLLTVTCTWKYGRTRKASFYDISSGKPEMVRRGSRRSVDPPYKRVTAARNLPNVPLVGA